jgi:ribosomal-protein-alanine N-acetyltransferase
VELAELVALETAIFPDAWSEKTLAEALGDEKYLILVERYENGAAKGYFIGWIVGEEAEIGRIGVAAAWRGQGIGGVLLDQALRFWHSWGATKVFLEVRESNEIARRLYASRGFLEIARRKNYYEDGEAALVFRLELSDGRSQ